MIKKSDSRDTHPEYGAIQAPYSHLVLSLMLIILTVGCSAKSQSIDALLYDARSNLENAQKAGADELAKSEFDEAKALIAEAETAFQNGDKSARAILEKAKIKAVLAETLARQKKAESEAARLEEELEAVLAEATRIRQEREALESELR
jgi:hypothetical protein